jgi:hypothetical protein
VCPITYDIQDNQSHCSNRFAFSSREETSERLIDRVMLVTVFLVAGISMTIGWRPIIGAKARPLTTRNFERSPQRLERGGYIFMGLSGCVHCHSPLEGSQRGFPPVMSLMGPARCSLRKLP